MKKILGLLALALVTLSMAACSPPEYEKQRLSSTDVVRSISG